MNFNVLIWSIPIIFISVADKIKHGSNEKDKLVTLHLQMYTNYCGDIVTCDSDTGHPESPIDYAMPVPCCLPCPCLQPCSTNKQPCCPESGSHNDNHSYFKASGEISTSNHIDQFSVTQSKEHTTTDVYPHRSVINQQEGSQSEFDYDNHTDVIQSVTDAAKRGVTNTGTTVHLLPHTYCIRPQLFNHPNFFIDSDAYMMVKFCFRGKEMVDKCYGEHVNTGMSDMTPITSRLSGLTYVNRFCFMCNEGDVINETLADVWDVMSVYYKTEYHHRSVFHPDEMTDLKIGFSAGFSNIHFVPRMRNLVQPCEAYDVNSCNQTGLWDAYDETVEKICHEGHSVPILHRISYGYDRLRFKNIACVYCNAGDNFNSNTTLSCGYRPRKKAVYSYSQTLNLRVLDTDKENDEVREKQLISYTQRAILPLPNTDICPSGYIALLDRCRRVICPRDQYARDNKCVPLYSSMTGLDVNVKIEISLVDKVPSKFYSEVLNELENIVNNSLAKCVTLQSREITVWYGPKENKVSDKYYMFDIYLFNASHKIDFGTSVKEIRAFYNNLKTHGSIRVLNGADMRIKIDFSHKLIAIFYQYYDMSISGDGSFRVLLRRRMEDSKIRPSMVISNVNWCYRVPFDIVNETEMIGMEAYIVKPAGITVYKSQYDIPRVSKIHQLYLCFDLFISYFDKDTSEITHDGVAILSDDMTILQPDTDEDDGKILTLSVPVNIAIIAACFGLCVVCVLCKARFKHVEPNALSGTQAIPDTGTVSNVRMSEERAQHIEMVGQDLGNTDSAYNSRETKIN